MEGKENRFWSPDDNYRLLQLWRHHSASHIGKVLGRTRSAVIGRINRLKETGAPLAKVAIVKTAVKGARPKRRRIRIKVIPAFATVRLAPDHPAAPDSGLRLVELESWHCRFPIAGEPRDGSLMFCGATRRDDSAYCPHHHTRAYLNRQPK